MEGARGLLPFPSVVRLLRAAFMPAQLSRGMPCAHACSWWLAPSAPEISLLPKVAKASLDCQIMHEMMEVSSLRHVIPAVQVVH